MIFLIKLSSSKCECKVYRDSSLVSHHQQTPSNWHQLNNIVELDINLIIIYCQLI